MWPFKPKIPITEKTVLLEKILAASGEGIVLSDAQNKIISVNRAFTEIMGYVPDEIVGKLGSFLRSGHHDDAFYADVWHTVNSKGVWQGEMWVRRKNGEVFPEWLVFSAIKDPQNNIAYYLAIFSDITERKASADRIQYLAHFDPLTNLPNRSKMNDYLAACLINAQHNNKKVALFYLDLDRFKHINASFGLVVGDQLLQTVATRLKLCIREGELLARLSGDEFVIIVPASNSAEEVVHLAQRILDVMQAPFVLDANSFNITPSIGISMYPADGNIVDMLIKNAESAMYKAKKNGCNNYQFFTQDMNVAAVEYLTLEMQIRRALEREEFELYYHPLVSLATNEICGVEALIRWTQPDVGAISPSKFIPVAEECGLIVPITEWALKTACQTNMTWLAAGLPATPVAVNISSLHFRQKDFQQWIAKLLQETGLNPHNLKLELTEGIIMQDAEETIKALLAMKELGLRFSIDDFGTGYSSLSYLKRFPIDQLKIDQSFVRDLVTNADDRAIIRAIISLAKSLKLLIIAEGVETKEQLAFLREQQCDVVQGYYFSKPIPSAELMQMLKEKKRLQD